MNEARIEAARLGQLHYEGRECVHGHGVLRYVISGACVACAKDKSKKSYVRIRDRLRSERRT